MLRKPIKRLDQVDFRYIYKTSDGIRHEGTISASSRDSAFSELRGQGIRPIKVLEINSPWFRIKSRSAWLAITLWGISALSLLIWWGSNKLLDMRQIQTRYKDSTRESILRLIEKANALETRHHAELKLLDLDRLQDARVIAQASDFTVFYREIDKARGIINYSRIQTKDMFKDVYTMFSAGNENERTDAQRKYGELMQLIDTNDESLLSLQYALMLLDENRGKWRVEDAKLIFEDKRLEEDYRFHAKPVDQATLRWMQDFHDSDVNGSTNTLSQESN